MIQKLVQDPFIHNSSSGQIDVDTCRCRVFYATQIAMEYAQEFTKRNGYGLNLYKHTISSQQTLPKPKTRSYILPSFLSQLTS